MLNGVDLSVREGEIFTVIGKSGTGKSVLLKHIIGLMHQDEGRLLVNGRPLDGMNRSGRHEFQRNVSYMFQDNALFDFLTVNENVALPLSEKSRLSPGEINDRVGQLLSILGLENINTKFPAQLSGGMRKRVAMARALITRPKVVLFDEPTTGLDPVRKRNVNTMIARYQQHFGFTAVIVSHDIRTYLISATMWPCWTMEKSCFREPAVTFATRRSPLSGPLSGERSFPRRPEQNLIPKKIKERYEK